MDNNFTYDLLIFSARREEIWFLEQYFRKHLGLEDDIPFDDFCSHIMRVENYKGMNIGLVCIDGMGNVLATLRAYEVIDRVLPKSVVMVGVAAAVPGNIVEKGHLNLGDVGISSQINYYSLGKKKENVSFHEIRPTGESQTIISNNIISRIVKTGTSFQNEVNDLIREWWRSADYDIGIWVDKSVDPDDHNDYLMNPISVDDKTTFRVIQKVCYASGEFVLSDEKYVGHIYNAFGSTNNVRMIDMESYGISNVCSAFRVHYLTIKGASDYAGKEKSDAYRWVSTAAASATCIKLIDKELFKSHNLYPTAQRIYNSAACLIQDVHGLCPEDKQRINKNDWRHRRCLDDLLGNFPSKGTINNLSRIHEDISPIMYSVELDDLLENFRLSSEVTQRLTFFFPYGALDLLEFFVKAENNQDIEKLVIGIRKAISSYQNGSRLSKDKKDKLELDLVNKLNALTTQIKNRYTHFRKMDSWCEEHRKDEGIPDISRVIIFDGGENVNNETIINDPLNFVYPLLLGTNVPTYYTTSTILNDLKYPSPDAIYISSKNCGYGDFHTVLRYSDDFHSLIVSGVPCNIVPDKLKRDNNQSINSLYIDWIKSVNKLQTNNGFYNDGIFKKFPTQEILEKYSNSL